MKPGDHSKPLPGDSEWESRKAANTRLGWMVGGVVVLLFLGSIWKYLPG